MPIPFTCPYCGHFTTAGDEYAGTTGPCAGCGAQITIPHGVTDSANPYESPEGTWVPYDASAQQEGGVVWLLFSFQGRIPRRLWWIVSILKNVILVGAAMVFLVLALSFDDSGGSSGPSDAMMFAFIGLYGITMIPVTWITLALAAKRFHDRDKSGWWCLITYLPYIGPIWILIECGCLRGTYGPNMFGPDPT